MSSTEYAELAGLNIALSNLRCVGVDQRDEEWVSITEWLTNRVKQLTGK